MKKWKRFLPLSLALSLTLLASCGSSDTGTSSNAGTTTNTPSSSSTTDDSGSSAGNGVVLPENDFSLDIEPLDFDFSDVKIGVVQLAEHSALDAATDGFVSVLVASGMPEENIEIQNAQGEQVNCSTIATKFVNDNKDLVLAVATPAAQAMAGATSSIPILATAVTDFQVAGLTASNISGVSDMGPIEAQIDLLLGLVPDASSIGILYCSSEDNSIMQADLAKTILQNRGVNPVVYTVAESSEVQQATQAAVNSVDGIYVPTDNLLAQTMATVVMIANPAGVPVIVGESGMVESGGLATIGVDYASLGRQTAAQALRILVDGDDVSEIPVEFSLESDWKPAYREDTFAELGLDIPAGF